MAWVHTAGSAASTAPPLGQIRHFYTNPTSQPVNAAATYCFSANSTLTSPANVPDDTGVLMKPCVNGNAMQNWSISERDGTIRLGNTAKCLYRHDTASAAAIRTPKIKTCVTGSPAQNWQTYPSPPGISLTGYEYVDGSVLSSRYSKFRL